MIGRVSSLILVSLLGAPSLASGQCPAQAESGSVLQVGPDTIQLHLESVWRDFKPGAYRTADLGSDLMVAFTFHNLDRAKLRTNGPITQVWVRRDREWASLSVDSPWVSRDTLTAGQTARGGPTWPVDALVDVVVEWLVDGVDRCTIFPRHRITRTI